MKISWERLPFFTSAFLSTLAVFLFFALVLTGQPSVRTPQIYQGAPVEGIENGGFEEIKIEGWEFSENSSVVDYGADLTNLSSGSMGSQCLRVTPTVETGAGEVISIEQEIDVSSLAGHDGELTIRNSMKVSGDVQARMYYQFIDDDPATEDLEELAGSVLDSGDWSNYEKTGIVVPPGKDLLKIILRATRAIGGSVWFDDIEVEEATLGDLLINGGFEEITVEGWEFSEKRLFAYYGADFIDIPSETTGIQSLEITPITDEVVVMEQKIDVTSLEATGEEFTISGSVLIGRDAQVKMYYKFGNNDLQEIVLADLPSEWQDVSEAGITVPAGETLLTVILETERTTSSGALFDDISLNLAAATPTPDPTCWADGDECFADSDLGCCSGGCIENDTRSFCCYVDEAVCNTNCVSDSCVSNGVDCWSCPSLVVSTPTPGPTATPTPGPTATPTTDCIEEGEAGYF